ncbi:Protein of unknown function (DUF2975) [Mesonia algae]|uniref:DUF2975 family protein n=1 Tax=Mesonia algae TaxID=213248 RepID=A0A2W7IEA9_9FLAO|nr:DUF2975 domain-containing protein [Mesonia algae]PZW43962.1 Protein of unknown function (DUF2975) [Mesonia algae]
MKTLSILRKLISFIYGLFMTVSILVILAIFYMSIFGNGFSEDFTFNNYEVTNKIQIKFILSVYAIIVSTYIYTLFLFKKLVYDFSPTNIFTSLQIFYLNRIGKLIIGITITEITVDFLLKIFYNNRIEASIKTSGLFENYFFIIAVGLFFIFLSEIFKIAKHHKQENELTV